jgi:hypothetical protein
LDALRQELKSNKLKDAEPQDLWITDHVINALMGFNHTINPKRRFFCSNFIFHVVTNTEQKDSGKCCGYQNHGKHELITIDALARLKVLV